MLDSAIDQAGVAIMAASGDFNLAIDKLTPPPMALGRRRARYWGSPSPGVRRGFLIPRPGWGGIGERPGPIPHLLPGVGKKPLSRDAVSPHRRTGWNRAEWPLRTPGRSEPTMDMAGRSSTGGRSSQLVSVTGSACCPQPGPAR